MAVPIKVKWGKEVLQLEVDPNDGIEVLRSKLKELTHIPEDKQKIMGLRAPTSGGNLLSMGVSSGKQLMLIGTPEGTVVPTVEKAETAQAGAGEIVDMKGIPNLGNTCYLNSALQLIRNIPEIQDVLLNYRGPNTLLTQLGLFLKNHSASTGPPPSMLLVPFFQNFLQRFPTFAERGEHNQLMQQDAHEALNNLLQEIQTALPGQYKNLFVGQLEQTLKYANGTESSSRIPFTILTCNISGDVQTIESGLQKAFNEEFQTDDENQENQTNTRTSRLSTLPEYLLIHLVRFSWLADQQKKAKILKPIGFPLILDTCTLSADTLTEEQKPIREALKQQRDEEIERRKRSRNEQEKAPAPPVESSPLTIGNGSGYYELCGVVSHQGAKADSGHYIYWGKKGDTWVVYDDENSAIVSEADVLRLKGAGTAHSAYVLLYRSRNPVTKRPVLPY